MTTVLGPCCEGFCTVYVDGPLVVPVNPDLLTRVRTLLLRGRRGIVLDLSRVSRIDAGGVGELVRAYKIAGAADVSLRIVRTTKWVRETLERVGLFDLLSADDEAENQSSADADRGDYPGDRLESRLRSSQFIQDR
jgi:anti-anti-sigma factor